MQCKHLWLTSLLFFQQSWISYGKGIGGGTGVGMRTSNTASGAGSSGGGTGGGLSRTAFGAARKSGVIPVRPHTRPKVFRWVSADAAGRSAVGPPGLTHTGYSIAGVAASKSAANRPSIGPPPAMQIVRVEARYAALTDGKAGSSRGYVMAGTGGLVGGYLLGRLLVDGARRSDNTSEGLPEYYSDYVPFRYGHVVVSTTNTTNSTDVRNSTNSTNSTNSSMVNITTPINGTTTSNFEGDLCTLARWNMILPFTEFPNMAFNFLAADNISGSTITDKSRFLFELLNLTSRYFGSSGAKSNVFLLPQDADLRACNISVGINQTDGYIPDNVTSQGVNLTSVATTTTTTVSPTTVTSTVTSVVSEKPWYAGALLDQWRQMARNGDKTICAISGPGYAKIPGCEAGGGNQKTQTDEPIIIANMRLSRLYTNLSTDPQLITDLVESAKRCYLTSNGSDIPTALLPCLDYSLSSNQVLSLQNQTRIFVNEELCTRFLSPDIGGCLKGNYSSNISCTQQDLVNLNVFARNYYLCADPIAADLLTALQAADLAKAPSIVAVVLPVVSPIITNATAAKVLEILDIRNAGSRGHGSLLTVTMLFLSMLTAFFPNRNYLVT